VRLYRLYWSLSTAPRSPPHFVRKYGKNITHHHFYMFCIHSSIRVHNISSHTSTTVTTTRARTMAYRNPCRSGCPRLHLAVCCPVDRTDAQTGALCGWQWVGSPMVQLEVPPLWPGTATERPIDTTGGRRRSKTPTHTTELRILKVNTMFCESVMPLITIVYILSVDHSPVIHSCIHVLIHTQIFYYCMLSAST
jgi:hypothetical protein